MAHRSRIFLRGRLLQGPLVHAAALVAAAAQIQYIGELHYVAKMQGLLVQSHIMQGRLSTQERFISVQGRRIMQERLIMVSRWQDRQRTPIVSRHNSFRTTIARCRPMLFCYVRLLNAIYTKNVGPLGS